MARTHAMYLTSRDERRQLFVSIIDGARTECEIVLIAMCRPGERQARATADKDPAMVNILDRMEWLNARQVAYEEHASRQGVEKDKDPRSPVDRTRRAPPLRTTVRAQEEEWKRTLAEAVHDLVCNHVGEIVVAYAFDAAVWDLWDYQIAQRDLCSNFPRRCATGEGQGSSAKCMSCPAPLSPQPSRVFCPAHHAMAEAAGVCTRCWCPRIGHLLGCVPLPGSPPL